MGEHAEAQYVQESRDDEGQCRDAGGTDRRGREGVGQKTHRGKMLRDVYSSELTGDQDNYNSENVTMKMQSFPGA